MCMCVRTIQVYSFLQQALGMSPCVHKIFERHGAWPCAAPENIYLMRKCARAAALCRWHLPKVT